MTEITTETYRINNRSRFRRPGNGPASYVWSTTAVRPGTYYIGAYLWSSGSPKFSHLVQPITILA